MHMLVHSVIFFFPLNMTDMIKKSQVGYKINFSNSHFDWKKCIKFGLLF